LDESDPRQAQRAVRILEAASDLFAHYGFDKTTMDDIARAAGVSKGAIYLHFRGKDDLFDALIAHESALLQTLIMQRLEAEANLNIFSLYRHSIEAALERPVMRALMISDTRVLGDFMRRMKGMPRYEATVGFRTDFVQQLQQVGMIRADADPEALSAVLMAIKFGYLSLPDLIDSAPPPEVTGAAIADMLQRAYGTEFGDSEAGREVMRQLFARGREFMQAMRDERRKTSVRDST
jgi:AcrR family transcriptional regulator